MDTDHIVQDESILDARGQARVIAGLEDAASMARAYRRTFEVPTAAALKAVAPGAMVKLTRNGERFWVEVTGFEKRTVHGFIANELQLNHDLVPGERIRFQKRHIYDLRT